MAQKRRCRASVSTSMNKNNFCSDDNGAFTLILFSIQCILELKTAILSRNLSTVGKKQDPCIFVRVKPVLMLILINWLDRLLNNNYNNNNNNDNNNNNISNNNNNNYYYFSNNSNDNINSKEHLGEAFRSVNELALSTCSAVPCILYSIRRTY